MMPGNPIVGSTVLRRPAIASPNFVHNSAGWSINSDGSAEFNNLTIRGTFNGTDYLINSTGIFLYSATPAANNLVNSVTNFSGTDSFGNHYLTGSASYGINQAVANVNGVLFFYTGSLAAGWTQQGSIQADTSTGNQIDTTASLSVGGPNLIVNGTNIILALSGQPTTTNGVNNANTTGSSANAGLPDGTIHGTSGGASAGTAHTHGPGSFAVGNGNHNHAAGSYAITDSTHAHDLPTI